MNTREILHLSEASYPGNVGAMEMFRFHKTASKEQKAKMKKIIADRDWSAYKRIIKTVLVVDLK